MKVLELLMREKLPSKNFFNIQEISSLLNVKPQEIRYWESEFPQVEPQKTSSGQRIYRRQDAIVFFAIKHLLHDKKLTLLAAQRIIAQSDVQFSDDTDLISACDPITARAFAEKPVTPQITTYVAPDTSFYDDDDEFDQVRHKLYQNCQTEIVEEEETECRYAGEMLKDALKTNENKQGKLSKLDYEQAFYSLSASKQVLSELLNSLEKYRESEFFRAFK